MRRKIVVGALIAALVLIAGAMVVSVTAVNRSGFMFFGPLDKAAVVDRTLAVTGTPNVSVTNMNGTITITRGAENAVVVHAVKRATSDENLAKLDVQIQQNGNQITIQSMYDGRTTSSFFLDGRFATDYEIQLPPQVEVAQARSSNSSITVRGIAGRLDLHATNGTIAASDVNGDVTAETSNGRVNITGGQGALHLGTSNGEIMVQNVQAQGLEARTSNGSVRFAGSFAAGSKNSVQTSNGSATLTLPAESALRVDLDSSNGSVTVAFPVTTTTQGDTGNRRHHVQGVIGNQPSADLSVHTGNGSITIIRQGV